MLPRASRRWARGSSGLKCAKCVQRSESFRVACNSWPISHRLQRPALGMPIARLPHRLPVTCTCRETRTRHLRFVTSHEEVNAQLTTDELCLVKSDV
eukprot:1879193-Prymnesium_polylepis.1